MSDTITTPFSRSVHLACAAAVLMAVAGVTQAQVHRCSVQGQTILQDRPCEGTPSPGDAQPATRTSPVIQKQPERPPMGDPAYEKAREEERRRQVEAYGRRAGKELGEAMAATEARCGTRGEAPPHVGATASWVRSCSTWGQPTRVNTTTTAAGETQMWVFEGRGFLYFGPDERVRTIQTN